MDIRHIPGKKNPADSLSRQLITDALVRKSSVPDANAEYVQRLGVPENATNEQIQDALYRLFNSSPQGRDSQIKQVQGPQGQTVLSEQTPQGPILSTNEEQCPQGKQSRKIIAATAVSKVQWTILLKILCILCCSMRALMLKFCRSCRAVLDKWSAILWFSNECIEFFMYMTKIKTLILISGE